MATELEVKAIVPDPGALRRALLTAGARESFRGMLRDRRLDRGGELQGRDEIFRLRRWIPRQGVERAEIGWKGAKSVSAAGYKRCEEIEFAVGDGGHALRLLETLGYSVFHAIDRYVEVYQFDDVVARLEWYPRMDVLVEIEGTPQGIERLITIAGIPRSHCVPDALAEFGHRYEARTGRRALFSEQELGDEPPAWSAA